MNSTEIINVINYLNSTGLISLTELDCNFIEYPISQQSFILILAQMLKRKSSLQSKNLSNDIYTKYIFSDNTKIVQVFKHLMIIYQQNQRKTKMNYYFKWLTYTNRPDNKICQHFGFMIAKENAHERLFNYYKNKELILNRLENMYSTDEAEKCPFTPTINQKYLPISSRTNCKYRSRCEEKDCNSYRNVNHQNKQSHSTTHANTNLYYTSLLSNKSNTIDYSLSTKRQSSITPRGIKNQLNSHCNNKSYSNCPETNNAEMKYVINYLTNQSGESLFQSHRQRQTQYQSINNKNQFTTSYSNLLSNRDRRVSNESNKTKGQLFRGTTRGVDSSKISQFLKDSNLYQYLNNNYKNKENHYENSSSTNIYDKITSYLSQENQTNQMSSTENNFHSNSKKQSKTKAKQKSIEKSNPFFYTFNNKGKYNQYKQLKKKNPLIITPPCKSTQIMLNKSNKEYLNDDYLNINDEIASYSNKNHNSNQTQSNAIVYKNTLQVISGVVNEFFLDKNNNYRTINNNHSSAHYNNQITLQSLSDSKLYEIANHYITTDESFNRNKCLSNSKRRMTQRHLS